jgi:vesicle coat complex subunit
MKIDIMSRLLDHDIKDQNCGIVLSELVHYISMFESESSIVSACLNLIVKIAIICEDYAGDVSNIVLDLVRSGSAVVSMEAIRALQSLFEVDTIKTGHVIETLKELSEFVHILTNDSAKISALWLLSLCHDELPLHAANVVRAVCRNLPNEDGLVKLHLTVLVITAIQYHEKNTSNGQHAKISTALLPPLRLLFEYIVNIGSRDPLVGLVVSHLGKNYKDQSLLADTLRVHVARVLSQDRHTVVDTCMHREIFRASASMVSYDRPESDSEDASRVLAENSGLDTKFTTIRTFSSSQSASNRCSANVLVPADVTKPIVSLEDLDLFFTKTANNFENVASPMIKVPQKPQEKPVATIDPSELC